MELRSGKEFWDDAVQGLNYTKEYGYDESCLLWQPQSMVGTFEEYGDYTMFDYHYKLDDLSLRIALESGQAEITPYGFKYKNVPERFTV
jgi:hypothetical protein